MKKQAVNINNFCNARKYAGIGHYLDGIRI